MIVIKVFVLIGFFIVSKSHRVFMPNLPLGEYRTIYDKVYHCEPSKNHSILYNVYFSKKSPSLTELKGNVTSSIPFDDTLTIDLNFASWSLTGGWKPNSMVYITKNGCTKWKNVLGNVWFSLKSGFNFPTDSCPIPANGEETYFSITNSVSYINGSFTILLRGDFYVYVYDVLLHPRSTKLQAKRSTSYFFSYGGHLFIYSCRQKNCPVSLDNEYTNIQQGERNGTYISSGINLKEFEDHNFPKVYFYGKYKAVFKIKNDQNKVLGCLVVEFQLVRPWEKPV